jgi:hypothetical protein
MSFVTSAIKVACLARRFEHTSTRRLIKPEMGNQQPTDRPPSRLVTISAAKVLLSIIVFANIYGTL